MAWMMEQPSQVALTEVVGGAEALLAVLHLYVVLRGGSLINSYLLNLVKPLKIHFKRSQPLIDDKGWRLVGRVRVGVGISPEEEAIHIDQRFSVLLSRLDLFYQRWILIDAVDQALQQAIETLRAAQREFAPAIPDELERLLARMVDLAATPT